MSKIPLKDRKAIKEAVPKAEAEVKKAADVLGTTLTCVDNTGDLYEKLADRAVDLGASFPLYFEALAKASAELSKNPLQKDALRDRLAGCGGRVLIEIIDASGPDNYWAFKDDGLHIEVKQSYWGSWLSYYNAEKLESMLSVDLGGVQLPLAVRRKLAEYEPKIEATLKKASDTYGSQLTWDMDQIPHVYEWLKKDGRATEEFGSQVHAYVEQFAKTLGEFCANPDNKEALQDAFKTNRAGFKLEDSGATDVYWIWSDGNLLMQVKQGYWGSWLSYYNSEYLEKTL